jgi:hypothetical protein
MTTRQNYLDRFESTGAAIEYENSTLQSGREFLPPVAIAVADGAEPTAEYWQWLIEQVDQSEAD